MPVESVRNVSVEDGWEPSVEQSETLEITFHSPEADSAVAGSSHAFAITPLYNDYPFSDPIKYKGEYHYKSQPTFGSSSTNNGQFEIRPQSGLIILETSGDRPSPSKIISALSETINQNLKIEREFVPGREQTWEFLSRMEEVGEIGEIEVIPPFGGVTKIDLRGSEVRQSSGVTLDEAIGNYPIEYAKVQLAYNSDPFTVEYSSGQLVIESSDPDDKEYVYQIFETSMMED